MYKLYNNKWLPKNLNIEGKSGSFHTPSDSK